MSVIEELNEIFIAPPELKLEVISTKDSHRETKEIPEGSTIHLFNRFKMESGTFLYSGYWDSDGIIYFVTLTDKEMANPTSTGGGKRRKSPKTRSKSRKTKRRHTKKY